MIQDASVSMQIDLGANIKYIKAQMVYGVIWITLDNSGHL